MEVLQAIGSLGSAMAELGGALFKLIDTLTTDLLTNLAVPDRYFRARTNYSSTSTPGGNMFPLESRPQEPITYTVQTMAPARATRTYTSEFPDYDGVLPELEGWTDSSWHNDVCPSLTKDNGMWKIWVDYVDPAMREFPDGKRFTVSTTGSLSELDNHDRLKTDNWQDVLDFFGIFEKGPASCQRYIEV